MCALCGIAPGAPGLIDFTIARKGRIAACVCVCVCVDCSHFGSRLKLPSACAVRLGVSQVLAMSLTDALQQIAVAEILAKLRKLLWYKALELSMVGLAERHSAASLKAHARVLGCVSQVAGEQLSAGEVAAWLRQRGSARLSNRFRAAVRHRPSGFPA